MGNQKWGHSGFPSLPPRHLSPPSRRHRPCNASPQLTPCPGTNESPRSVPRPLTRGSRGRRGAAERTAAPRSPAWWGPAPPGSYSWLPSAQRSSGRATSRLCSWWLGDGREKAAGQTHLPRSIQTPSSALDSGFYPPWPPALPTLPPPCVLPSACVFPGPVTLRLWGECDLESAEWEVSLAGMSEDGYGAHPPCPSPVTGPLRIRDVPLVPAAAHAW